MSGGKQSRIAVMGGILMAVLQSGLAHAGADANAFKTDIDKASYIIGMQCVTQTKAKGVDLNWEVLIRGIKEIDAGQKPPFREEEQAEIMTDLLAILGASPESQRRNGDKAEMDKVSYMMGAQMLDRYKRMGVEVNIDLLICGIREAMAGHKSPFTMKEENRVLANVAQAAMQKITAQQQQQDAQALEKLGADNAWKLTITPPEFVEPDAKKNYFWILETNRGIVKIKLMPDVAPMHVNSTIFLTKKGFYDGTVFHRVFPAFMAQGGDPLGTGRGGPGYHYDGEFSPDVKYDRPFLIGMANNGPETDGSQFFITFKPSPSLDGKNTIFGEVVEGQDTVKKLEAVGTKEGTPKEELKIVKARIEETLKTYEELNLAKARIREKAKTSTAQSKGYVEDGSTLNVQTLAKAGNGGIEQIDKIAVMVDNRVKGLLDVTKGYLVRKPSGRFTLKGVELELFDSAGHSMRLAGGMTKDQVAKSATDSKLTIVKRSEDMWVIAAFSFGFSDGVLLTELIPPIAVKRGELIW